MDTHANGQRSDKNDDVKTPSLMNMIADKIINFDVKDWLDLTNVLSGDERLKDTLLDKFNEFEDIEEALAKKEERTPKTNPVARHTLNTVDALNKSTLDLAKDYANEMREVANEKAIHVLA